MLKLTPELVYANRKSLADQYRDLLKVANGDKVKLLDGIRNLGGLNASNEEEFNSLTLEDLLHRIELHIDELDPKPVEYNHGQITEATTVVNKQIVSATKVSPEPVSQTELSPELQAGLDQIQVDFNQLPQLHPGIEWADVEKALRADLPTLQELIKDNADGFSMNVFGDEDGSYHFASAWTDYTKIKAEFRNIMFDKKAQTDYPQYKANGNAIDIAAKRGAKLSSSRIHNQLRTATNDNIEGWCWLETDEATRKSGYAVYGYYDGVRANVVSSHGGIGSLRFSRRVKKA